MVGFINRYFLNKSNWNVEDHAAREQTIHDCTHTLWTHCDAFLFIADLYLKKWHHMKRKNWQITRLCRTFRLPLAPRISGSYYAIKLHHIRLRTFYLLNLYLTNQNEEFSTAIEYFNKTPNYWYSGNCQHFYSKRFDM